MKYIVLIFSMLPMAGLFSQTSVPPKTIEDSVIGWVKIYNYKGAKEPRKVEDKQYSIAQLSICDSLGNWMQASYTPKGALGDIKRIVTGTIGAHNKHDASLPQSYGAWANTYLFLKRNSNGRLVPQNNLGPVWSVMANGVPGWPVRDLSTTSEYYFTMPSFESANQPEKEKQIYDVSNVDVLKPYITFWVKNIEAGGGNNYVLLSKNNQSPFVKLTRGEYLQVMEKAIPRYYESEKKKIYEQNPGNQRSIDYFMKYLDEKIERLNSNLKANREKYKDRLSEIALTDKQPTMNGLDNKRDLFSNGYITDPFTDKDRVPVYKLDSSMSARCRQDKPQWILISWFWSHQNSPELHMHQSILNNFNFDFVYRFFFEPEKVKGQPYKPLRSPDYKEAVVVREPSAERKKNLADKNVHFFEDFSTSAIGKKPIGWQASLGSQGTTSVVVNADGLEGNWVLMNDDYRISPAQLKKPLPQNFTLSYDLVAAQNFTWGAKGLILLLSKEKSPGNAESFISLKLRPGFDGRDGETTLETNFPAAPGYLNGTKWMKAPGFSNDKKNNRIHVVIKKSGEMLQVFIDNNKIAEYEKAVPDAQLFNALSFSSGSPGETNKY